MTTDLKIALTAFILLILLILFIRYSGDEHPLFAGCGFIATVLTIAGCVLHKVWSL